MNSNKEYSLQINRVIDQKEKEEIEGLLEEEGCSNYTFLKGDTVLIVESIKNKLLVDNLKSSILSLIS